MAIELDICLSFTPPNSNRETTYPRIFNSETSTSDDMAHNIHV